MNNVIQRKIVVSGAYQPLATTPIVASATISCPPQNAANVLFKGDDGNDVPWVPGEWHDLVRVDLSAIQVKGAPGDIVTVVGGSW